MSELPDTPGPDGGRGPRRVDVPVSRPAFVERLGYLGLAVTTERDRTGASGDTASRELVVRFELPVFGALALLFGVISLFHMPIVMAPLALVFAFVALRQQQTSFGLAGLVCGIVGLITSEAFWILIGLGEHWAEMF